ncbi:DUF1304 domain-containing protein [Altibacter sp. HG106]|uniref:DUF1304 domain-containing protein n=1 Tax=Altibacter sp. HG106 TaxID=3023937 RepID=UPI0023506D60|nr:DUF1304 domain-containing protein [Altibacter sp. HG106]MDC7993909.1 DUF1304 domain-containing protein [Altibacter sp. HG106]
MELLINLLIGLIALLHAYFLYFEMFAWATTGPRIFRGFPKDFFASTRAMAANQGLYNGFLVAGLLWTFFIEDPLWWARVSIFFLTCVVIAGIFGGLTASKKIFVVQALPAITALALLLIHVYIVS